MFIAAATVGAAIAGLLLYAKRKRKPHNRVLDAADDAYKTMNKTIRSIERPAQHAMG